MYVYVSVFECMYVCVCVDYVQLCRRLRVPKVKLILKVPKLLLPINYQLNANRMLFSKQPGHSGQYSVVIDSYQVPRAAVHGRCPQLSLFVLNVSPSNYLVLINNRTQNLKTSL